MRPLSGSPLTQKALAGEYSSAMRTRSLTGTLAVLAVIAASGALVSGCGSTAATLDPVAQAADATTRAGGAQMAFTGDVTVPGASGPFTITGSGHFNFAANEGELTLTMAGLPASATAQLGGQTLTMTELFKSGTLYMSSPLFAGKLPGGAGWMKLDLARVGQAIGLDPSSLASGGSDPAQYLSYLKAAGVGISVVGHETVRGVQTTHYAGSLDLLKAAEAEPGTNVAQTRAAFSKLATELGGTSVPMQVWVDGQDHVRKVSLTLTIATNGRRAETSIATEYFGFGQTPAVNLPSGGEVFDMTSQALQGLSSSG
jgi:hypothetical protein